MKRAPYHPSFEGAEESSMSALVERIIDSGKAIWP
jgi:hypothetical protein